MAKKNKMLKKTVKKSPTKKLNTQKKVAKKVVVKKQVKKPVKKMNQKTIKKAKPKTATQKAAKNTKTKKTIVKAVSVKPTAKTSVKSNVDYSKAVTPLGDRLVVRLAEGEKMTAGGLHIPDMVNTAVGYLRGEVLVVGHGQQNKKGFIKSMDVQKGDQVLFSEHAGTKVIFNSEELHIVNETDVLGIIQTK